MKQITAILCLICAVMSANASIAAIDSLALRVTEGTSLGKIVFTPMTSDMEAYRIIPHDSIVEISATGPSAMAVGLNRYLKDVARIHICWNNLTQPLPDVLPMPSDTITGSTNLPYRYYLNYCTFSYTMPFWDEDRWMKEIDWMALHGINLPLSIVGAEAVWRNVLKRLGYSDSEIKEFLPGPAYVAWWQMNNLEGWGGPMTDEWIQRQENLQKAIVSRMRSLGINPVLPGYSGMIPRTASEKLGLDVADPGLWCGFHRPAFLQPEDASFSGIAEIYYDELHRLYGKSPYYSMDPFHEGGNTEGVDMDKAGKAVMEAMKKANPEATWVIQAWQANPRPAMVENLNRGNLLVLDLYSEKLPQWGDDASRWYRKDGFQGHDWIYCMLLNFGGNIGMHGRMNQLVDGFNKARNSARFSPTLRGVGSTAEGVENNPVMYELLFDLPWIQGNIDVDEWLKNYLHARYGSEPSDSIIEAWSRLQASVYNAPVDYPGEGTVESIICARPGWHLKRTSTWGAATLFYPPSLTSEAASLMASQGEGNNFEYDFIDISRQANADEANRLLGEMSCLMDEGKTEEARQLSLRFLELIDLQDFILSKRSDMSVESWMDAAVKCADNDAQLKENVANAAMLITVWGDSTASNRGGLHDYSHREWGGLIRGLYKKRWEAFFDHQFNGAPASDYYRMELDWVDEMSRKYGVNTEVR